MSTDMHHTQHTAEHPQTVFGEPEALSIADVVRASGLGTTFLYAAMARGDLRARKAGRRTVVMKEDLRAFLASLPPYRPEAPSRVA